MFHDSWTNPQLLLWRTFDAKSLFGFGLAWDFLEKQMKPWSPFNSFLHIACWVFLSNSNLMNMKMHMRFYCMKITGNYRNKLNIKNPIIRMFCICNLFMKCKSIWPWHGMHLKVWCEQASVLNIIFRTLISEMHWKHTPAF